MWMKRGGASHGTLSAGQARHTLPLSGSWEVVQWRWALRSLSVDTFKELPRNSHPILIHASRTSQAKRYTVVDEVLRLRVLETVRHPPYFEVQLESELIVQFRSPVSEAALVAEVGLEPFFALSKVENAGVLNYLLRELDLPPVLLVE